MLKINSFLALIPARGGSKRLPKKNILPLNGIPLIGYTITAACQSRYINQIVVSSDDDEILGLAQQQGVYPLKRPDILATDTATTYEVIEHVIKNFPHYEYLVLLQPTSPLRTHQHIDEAIRLLERNAADAVVSVCPTEHSPLWSNTLPPNGDMSHFLPAELRNRRSQDLPTYYRLNGALYICRISKLLEEKSLFLKDKIFAYIMDKESSVDIDEKLDFLLAEVLLRERHA